MLGKLGSAAPLVPFKFRDVVAPAALLAEPLAPPVSHKFQDAGVLFAYAAPLVVGRLVGEQLVAPFSLRAIPPPFLMAAPDEAGHNSRSRRSQWQTNFSHFLKAAPDEAGQNSKETRIQQRTDEGTRASQ